MLDQIRRRRGAQGLLRYLHFRSFLFFVVSRLSFEFLRHLVLDLRFLIEVRSERLFLLSSRASYRYGAAARSFFSRARRSFLKKLRSP